MILLLQRVLYQLLLELIVRLFAMPNSKLSMLEYIYHISQASQRNLQLSLDFPQNSIIMGDAGM